MKKEGCFFSKMAVVSIEYGTLAIEVCLLFNFAVVFSSTYFLFRQEQTNYLAIGMLIGKAHRTVSVRFPVLCWEELEM
jgi:hypothetical protein